MSSFRFSSAANTDIENIAQHLFDLNPVAAGHFLDRLDAVCDMLATHPLMGKSRYDLAENLRSFAIGNYLVFTSRHRKALMSSASFMVAAICPQSSTNT